MLAEADRRHNDGMRWIIGKRTAADALRRDEPEAVGLLSLRQLRVHLTQKNLDRLGDFVRRLVPLMLAGAC